MVVVIFAGEDCHPSIVEAMLLLGHAEREALKQPTESVPLLMSRFDIEVGVGLLAIQPSGLFNQKRGDPWKNGYPRDSRFKEKPLKRGQTFRKKLCASSARNTIKL